MKASILLILLIGHPALQAGWHDRKAEGWAWYEDREEEKDELKKPQLPTEELAEIKKNLEEKLSQAVLNPTEETVLAYMQEQKKWLDQSSNFARIWTQLLLSNPYLDYTATGRPISHYGLQLHKKTEQEQKEQLITSVAQDYGLFFFYEGANAASPLFGNIVKEVSKKYDFSVVAISSDNENLEDFPLPKQDNGIAQRLGVDLYPALYLINPHEDLAVPISFGLVAMDQIENNIVLQFKDLMEKQHD